ncbi:winged helix-turn-helix domain-containing protein [Methanohalophilus sp. RSK]|uniref:helix-turn-helix transcriptional regulator n=1 Tax=Methanohalophilus sp. RSK TaxID=2485783 RepID=UPI000F43C1E3|nr:winged helix-turn-helix domain-containing protein [Methanohalophilus sp. RSK]RNI12448.1 winged helix-turn-helix domain-containing protein [Methanohalophilus sp. RSK]
MKTSLIETILMSDKRKDVLLLLYNNGTEDIDEIKDILGYDSSGLTPQIKKLLDWDLIIQDHHNYKLSDMGYLIVEKMQKLLDIAKVFEENHDYWESRDLSEIPEHMLKRVGELGHCYLIEPDRHHLFEHHPHFIEKSLESKYLMMASSSFNPQTISVLCEAADKSTDISYIITKPVLERSMKDCKIDLDNFFSYNNTNLYLRTIERDIEPITVAVSDIFVSLWLFDKNHRFNRITLISYDNSAIAWGEDLFKYYLNNSKPITYKDI